MKTDIQIIKIGIIKCNNMCKRYIFIRKYAGDILLL